MSYSVHLTGTEYDLRLISLSYILDSAIENHCFGAKAFNYSIAYDKNNREPLFYVSYPGSIVDISQLQC